MAITDIPIAVGNSIGITDESDALLVGGLILSAAIMFSIIMAMNYASRGRDKNILGEIVVMFSTMGLLTTIGWLDVWIMIIALVVVATLFAGEMKRVVTK